MATTNERIPTPYVSSMNADNAAFSFTCRMDCDYFSPDPENIHDCEWRDCLPECAPECGNPDARRAALRWLINTALRHYQKMGKRQ